MFEMLEKWDLIKEAVRKEYELSDVSFNTWVKPLKLLSVEGNVVNITISSDNQNFLKYINKNYKDYFKVTISEMFDNEFDIVFCLENENEDKNSLENVSSNNVVYNINSENANLIPKYKFDNFVVGANNKMAHAAAVAVAETPGSVYNPLYIYGGSGLGKTHLMHAIGHYILEQNPNTKVLYVSSETFTNEVIDSIRNGDAAAINKVRDKYRSVDVLMVDDVQFIIGKPSTQEEFFHTFNALYSANKQIIISSDKPPKNLENLDERFSSRFEWGLITDIQPPDYETRMAILMKLAENFDYKVDETIIKYIANNITSNIRQLEGAFKKIISYYKLSKVDLTIEAAEEALRDVIYPDKPVVITPSYIIDIVAEHFSIKREDIISKKKSSDIAYPRQIAMYLCCSLTDYSLSEIGKALGGKDHSTILYGRDKIAEDIKKDSSFAANIETIKKKISTN